MIRTKWNPGPWTCRACGHEHPNARRHRCANCLTRRECRTCGSQDVVRGHDACGKHLGQNYTGHPRRRDYLAAASRQEKRLHRAARSAVTALEELRAVAVEVGSPSLRQAATDAIDGILAVTGTPLLPGT